MDSVLTFYTEPAIQVEDKKDCKDGFRIILKS